MRGLNHEYLCILRSVYKLSGAKKAFALPEDALRKEIEKQNRHRGVFTPTDRNAYYETIAVNGFPCLIVREHPKPSERAILYFFGGGMVIGPDKGDLPVMRKLCRETGCDVWFPFYPLCMEHCITETYAMVYECYRKMINTVRLAMVVASSIGADLAMAFLTQTKLPVEHAFFDGGQFAQIGKGTRRIMTPFLYLAIKSLYWSKGGTLKKILWCGDDSIKPYFIAAGKNLTYTNLRRQILDSLEDKPFPALSEELQKHLYFEFGSIEDHFKYRQAVIEAYPCGNYPVFEGYDHMQYQIRDPKGFAEMLAHIAERDCMPELPFIRK